MKNKLHSILNYFKPTKRRWKRNSGKKVFIEKQTNTRYKRKRRQLILNFQKVNILWLIRNNLLYTYGVLGFILLLSILFIIFWPLFKVQNINIIRQDDITNINIAYNAVNSFRWEKIFLTEAKNIEKKLKNYQENIKHVDVETILPDTLKIIIQSYIGYFNTVYQEKNYIISQNWAYIPAKPNSQLKTLKVIDHQPKKQFVDYKQILSPKSIEIIYNAVHKLEENIVWLNIKNLSYYTIEKELHVTLENDTLLIYSVNEETYNQIEKTAIFHKEQIALSKNTLVYVDLRVKNKIFYCDKEKEFQCKLNIKRIYSVE